MIAVDPMAEWFALMVGNTHHHWAWFSGTILRSYQQTKTQAATSSFWPESFPQPGQHSTLWRATVVPLDPFMPLPVASVYDLGLTDIPLKGVYDTLGIDRALAVWGAIAEYGAPALVIDAGTALTITGVDQEHHFIGGAILPGLGLMATALHNHTARLPAITLETQTLPDRWAKTTPTAIESGIFYTVGAGVHTYIQAWVRQFPASFILLTGGDRQLLAQALNAHQNLFTRQSDSRTPILDPHLIFWGIRQLRCQRHDLI